MTKSHDFNDLSVNNIFYVLYSVHNIILRLPYWINF